MNPAHSCNLKEGLEQGLLEGTGTMKLKAIRVFSLCLPCLGFFLHVCFFSSSSWTDFVCLSFLGQEGSPPAPPPSSQLISLPCRRCFQTERDSGIPSSKFPEEKSGSGQAGPRSEQATGPWKNAAPPFPPAWSWVPLTFSH